MFPRRLRLTRADFASVAVAHGRRLSSPNFSVVIPAFGVKGYAVVVSKKTARLSVTRHRIKRRVLAALRELQLPPSLLVFPKPSSRELSPSELKNELRALLSKVAPRT